MNGFSIRLMNILKIHRHRHTQRRDRNDRHTKHLPCPAGIIHIRFPALQCHNQPPQTGGAGHGEKAVSGITGGGQQNSGQSKSRDIEHYVQLGAVNAFGDR